MKRWLKRIGIVVLVIIVVIVAGGATWEMVARRAAARDFPPPGTLVDIGGRRIQLDCRGSGSPTVVLIHGLDTGGALSWTAVHDSIAATTRTCAYSRAGIMWSDPGAKVVTAKGVAEDLHAALEKGGEHPPFVLVGHSLGGPYEMVYTKLYGDQVAGMVMVDASHPDQIERMWKLAPAVAATSMTPLKIGAALSWTGAIRLLGARTAALPNEPAAGARAKAAYLSTSIDGALREGVALPSLFKEAGTFRTLGDRPLVVLTAMKPMTDAQRAALQLDEKNAKAFKEVWREMHVEEASWSTRGRQVLVPDATHYIQFDRPDIVIGAVREVVDSVRVGAPAAARVAADSTVRR